MRTGLMNVRWPGRLQLIKGAGGQKLLLDGAHNIGGAESLRVALQTYFAAESPTLVLGIFLDKDCAAMCEILAPLASRIVLVPVNSQRTATHEGTGDRLPEGEPQSRKLWRRNRWKRLWNWRAPRRLWSLPDRFT